MIKPKNIDVIIGCEKSQVVCEAFRALGFNAFSCDTEPATGSHPEWHLQMDVFEALRLRKWTLGIFHPPCTFMSKAGARFMFPKAGIIDEERLAKAMEAKQFFMRLLEYGLPYEAVENPTPLKVVGLPEPSQVIQPYQFGHPFSKRTLLWTRNLPQLEHTDVLDEYKPFLPSNTGGAKRGQKHHRGTAKNADEASVTFKGVGEAMAEQWGAYVLKKEWERMSRWERIKTSISNIM